jgi:hypothetical protein
MVGILQQYFWDISTLDHEVYSVCNEKIIKSASQMLALLHVRQKLQALQLYKSAEV